MPAMFDQFVGSATGGSKAEAGDTGPGRPTAGTATPAVDPAYQAAVMNPQVATLTRQTLSEWWLDGP